MKRFIPGILMLLGVGILASVLLPIGLSQLHFSLSETTTLIDPTVLAASSETVLGTQDAVVYGQDLASPNSWFDFQDQPRPAAPIVSKVSYYKVSIPSVGVHDATVEINGTDLMKNAIQYPGTAVPGTYGNTVIFGHSTLPQLYKPGNPVSIFNPVLKVKVGDDITVNYDGVTYHYVVRNTAIIPPTQIEVLGQRFDKHELTLITCTPLGTYINRFIVQAELVN